ncbi:hypothetical protein Vwe01_07300 [Micromonospora andamanensis]|nr:hypothetical protein Vwe01_07300 [Micromonospora andamanensis]
MWPAIRGLSTCYNNASGQATPSCPFPDISTLMETTVKYLMLIYGNEEIWGSLPDGDLSTLIGQVDAFNQSLRASGELVDVQGLVSRPRSVRIVDGTPVVTDGPYLEAKEYVGSYFVVDVDDEQRALEIAREYPGVRFGSASGGIEIWPLMVGDGAEH